MTHAVSFGEFASRWLRRVAETGLRQSSRNIPCAVARSGRHTEYVCTFGRSYAAARHRGVASKFAILASLSIIISLAPQASGNWPDRSTSTSPVGTQQAASPQQPASPAGTQHAGRAGTQQADTQQADTAKSETVGKQQTDAKGEEEKIKKKGKLMRQVATAHKPVYYNNDFSYLLDPEYRGYQVGDNLKRNQLFRRGRYDIGGEYRLRQHSENNMRGLGLTGVDDDFLLRRTRLYGNFEFTENIRVFGEMIDARSDFQNFAPRLIEVNDYDMLNLFVDARLFAYGEQSLSVRAGRQELLFGDQRLISPLDWANTRRTFDGYRFTSKANDWTVDGFWTRPVFPDPRSFDSPDLDQEFMGLYSTYSGREDQTIDLYAIRYLNNAGANDFAFNTLGSRWTGSIDDFLWDFEGMFQGGRNTDGSAHTAGSVTAGLGRKLSHSERNPILWFYFDWASGDDATGAGNGFHHLFPLAHKYNGLMDLFGRRNLIDANVLLTFKPTSRVNMLVWYHYFMLANGDDTPYSIAMTPFNPANAPGSRDLGHELDFLATVALSARQQLQLGYSYFWSGAYFSRTPGVPTSSDASFLYSQWSIAF